MVAQKPSSKSSGLAKFIWAIKQQESGGNYHAVSSAGALGAYQIMPGNIPQWSKQALGFSITPQQFIGNPKWQDEIARFKLAQYYNSYGPRGAAAAWYSGQPNPNARFGNPPVFQYVDDIMALMGRAPSNLGSGGSVPSGGTGGGAGGQNPKNAQTTGILGNITSALLGQGIGYGIEIGVTHAFEDVLKAWWVRIKWLIYMYVGIVGLLTTILAAIVWWMTSRILSNPNALAAIAAAPETGGASLLLGARGAYASERRERQRRGEERAEERLELARSRAGKGIEERQRRLEIAERRVGIQEERERRLSGTSGGPPIPAATRAPSATVAGNRIAQLAAERRRLIASGVTDPEEIRRRLRNLP